MEKLKSFKLKLKHQNDYSKHLKLPEISKIHFIKRTLNAIMRIRSQGSARSYRLSIVFSRVSTVGIDNHFIGEGISNLSKQSYYTENNAKGSRPEYTWVL